MSQGDHVIDFSRQFFHYRFRCLQGILHACGAVGDFADLCRHLGCISNDPEDPNILAVNFLYNVTFEDRCILAIYQIGGNKWEVLLFFQFLEIRNSQNQVEFADIDGINPDFIVDLRNQLRFKLSGLLDRFRDFFIFV